MNRFFICMFVLGLSAACTPSVNKDEAQTVSPPVATEQAPLESTARLAIYVKKDGTVLLNGKKTDLKELEAALKQQKEKSGTVFYSRDDQQQDPPEIAIQVMDLVAKQELPIQFYTDSAFTKVVSF